MKKALIILLLLLVTIGLFMYQRYQSFVDTPLQTQANQTFTIKSGTNIRTLAFDLQNAGILPTELLNQQAWLFVAYARLTGQAHKIKAGEYELKPEMMASELLDTFVLGQSIQYRQTIIEGKTFQDLVLEIKNNPNIQQTLSSDDYKNILTLINSPVASMSNPEGWFFADTYNFPRNTTDKEFLQRSHRMMYDYLMQAWDKRVNNYYIKTPYEALILASIVEKETGVSEERPLVARVFLNRLSKSMPLQTDPTIIYGLGINYDGNLRKADLQRDSPYNSYTRRGLPPTPIATPSKASIDAVFHPAESEALYFVATGKGGHNFSNTYREHQQAVASYLKTLRNKPTDTSETSTISTNPD